eukprot:TRINITY_DN20982_c0_g1_i2.p1 TRINITY_DN20982_c0_g1~~TRINITY_DN20982_c0_g1_i2.p1  ORF type:complete len:848 (+),score=323.11 TRINITY_DN20982_c0_g1_i2:33-2546(+)
MERRTSNTTSSYMDRAARSSISGTSSITNRPSHMKKREHRRAQTTEKAEQQIRVLDPEDKNIDRTPNSLLRQAPPTRTTKRGKKDESSAVMSPSVSGTEDRSGDKYSISRLESSESGSESSKMESSVESDDDDSLAGIERLALDDTAETSSMDSRIHDDKKKKKDKQSDEATEEGMVSKLSDAPAKDGKSKKQEKEPSGLAVKKREMTWQEKKEWREAPATVTLSETPTFFLLEKPDEQVCVSGDAVEEETGELRKKYERYINFCANSKGNDRYAERGMITFNEPSKNKETQKALPPVAHARSGVTVWDIHDTIKQLEEEEGPEDVIGIGSAEGADGGEGGKVDEGDMDDETSMMMQELDDDEHHSRDKHHRKKQWMLSPNVIERLTVVERVVVNNIWHVEQLLYRNLNLESPLDGEDDTTKKSGESSPTRPERERSEEKKERELESDPSLDVKIRTLWRFGCDLTKDKNVSCQSWNRGNPDLLGVGYGEYGIPGTDATKGRSIDGMVCCWSVKNPVHPERVYTVPNAGVSSIDFSHHHPSLLAVGNTDGTLALYDVRKQGNTPALKSTVQGGQHTGTIWEVKWVDKGRERNNDIVSISADGLIKQWTFKKGLECQCTLMRLKRTQNDSAHSQNAAAGNKGEALLSRQSGGMCLDFNPTEPIMYVVGTEDGTIHKCNTSNQEQYIQDFTGHSDPVYRVRWHPFCSDYFMSCSADWTARLWHEKRPDPVCTFDSTHDAIHDVVWSPVNANIFGTVTSTGRVDVWNIAEPLEPAASVQLDDRSLNCALFAQQESPVLTIGDNRGDVTVVKLKGKEFERPARTPEEQGEYFTQIVKKNTQ